MPEVKTDIKQCVHHWIIDAANGSTSFGRCRYCGLVKAFSNHLENPYFKQDEVEIAVGHDNTQDD